MLKLNEQFISQVKYLKPKHIQIMLYLYNWVLSPKSNIKLVSLDDSGLLYFFIYLDKLANDLFLTRRQVQNALFRLENKDKSIHSSLQPFIFPKQVKKENKLYIALNPEMIPFIISDNKISFELQKRLTGNSYNINKFENKDSKMLFEINEKRPNYSEESYDIVCKLINKGKEFGIFSHKIKPYGDEKQTKLLNEACKYVQMIYDGKFFSPRFYPFSDKYLNNKQFPINISKSKEIINSVKGDWNKIENLLFKSLNNFNLMFNEDRIPCDKKYLTKGINTWFYSISFEEAGKYQSQFLQSLTEPEYTAKFYSENKADNIFEKMDSKSKKYGEEIIDLSPNMPSGKAWKNMNNMINWAKLVNKNEPNCGYWLINPSEILKQYCEFMKKLNVIPSINCLDVTYRPESGKEPPFVWFLKDAIKTHKLNPNLVNCFTEEDFSKYYKDEVIW